MALGFLILGWLAGFAAALVGGIGFGAGLLGSLGLFMAGGTATVLLLVAVAAAREGLMPLPVPSRRVEPSLQHPALRRPRPDDVPATRAAGRLSSGPVLIAGARDTAARSAAPGGRGARMTAQVGPTAGLAAPGKG